MPIPVLLSQSLVERKWSTVIHYLIPLGFFAMGIVVAEGIRQKYKNVQRIHWRQLVLLMEMLLLLVVGFLPTACNLLANAMVSFACAMQVQSFRTVSGSAYASTMCIGNLRSCMESLCVYARTRDKHVLHKSACYLGIILMFAVGAGVGGHCIALFGMRTIWFSCLLLLISFLIMFINAEPFHKNTGLQSSDFKSGFWSPVQYQFFSNILIFPV